MSVSSATAVSASPPAAGRLAAGAGLALALAPLAMALASRSLPAVLAAALLLGAGSAWLSGAPGPMRRAWWTSARRGAALAFAGLLALLGLSAARAGFAGYGEAAFCAALAAAAVLVLPPVLPRWTMAALAAGMIAALGLIAYELSTGLAARHALGLRPNSFIFNRPVVVCVLLLWPVGLALMGGPPRHRALGLALAATVVAVAGLSESGSATFGLAIGAAAAAFAFAAPRLAVRLAMVATVAGFALAPVAGAVADRLLPERVHQAYAESNTRARIEIWRDFGATIPFAPVLGHGFNITRAMADHPVAGQVPPERARLLGAGHPHNAVLQVWVELGAAGALAALAGCLAVLGVIGRTSRRGVALRLAAYATIFSIAYVSHGAWQGWWIAAIGLVAVLFRSGAPSGAGEMR